MMVIVFVEAVLCGCPESSPPILGGVSEGRGGEW